MRAKYLGEQSLLQQNASLSVAVINRQQDRVIHWRPYMSSQRLWLKIILIVLQAHLTIVAQGKDQTGINTDTFDFLSPFYQSQLRRQPELIFFTLYKDNVYNILVRHSPESDLQQRLGVVCSLSYTPDHLIVRL